MRRKAVLPSLLLVGLLIAIPVLAAVPQSSGVPGSHNPLVTAMASSTSTIPGIPSSWPWGNQTGEFPWLNYLASLPHKQGITLVVITRHESTILQKTTEEFLKSEVAKKLGITNIQFVQAGPDQWLTYIKMGIQRGHPIDVAWGGGPTLFNIVDEAGYLQPLNPQENPAYYAVLYEMTKIPKSVAGQPTYKVGPDGYVHWVGAALSSFGFTVNHDVLKKYNLPMPETWSDLAKPVYGKYLPKTPLVGIADPTMSTSNTRMYEIILQAYGWDQGWKILTLMAANSKIYGGSGLVRDAVIRGDIAVGITIDFYGYTAMHQNPACEYIIPKGATIINADPIAIIKGTKHPVAAAAFVAWVLSEYGGQQIWLDPDINRLPINPLVFNTTAGHNRPDLYQAFEKAINSKGINFNDTLALETERAMQFYFKATLVNAHDDLQSTWAAILNAYYSGKINDKQLKELENMLTAPIQFKDPLTGKNTTFTLQYAIKINKKLTDQRIYQALMQEWESAARHRYISTYNALQNMLAGGQGTQGAGAAGGNATSAQAGGTSTAKHKNTNAIIAGIIGIIIIIGAAYFVLKK